jgi:leucyl aminopeptidase (aminopeptidase T)
MPSATGLVAIDNGTVLVLIALIAVPLAAIAFSRAGEAYRSIGQGALSIDQDLPLPRYLQQPGEAVDPAIQAAEVRQMLEAKASRLQRHGEAPIDVDAEAARLLAKPPPPSGQEAELRAEVRQLVVARNERRMRKGLTPLDVEAETDRQLADFIGSR